MKHTSWESVRDYFRQSINPADRLSNFIKFFREALFKQYLEQNSNKMTLTAPPDYQIVLSIDEAIRVGQLSQEQRDELAKNPKTTEMIDNAAARAVYEMLERCDRLMGPGRPYLWVLATSLEIKSLTYVRNGMISTIPGSGRPIELVPLHRPTIAERLNLFSKYKSIKDLELLLVYSGGHWRTLQAINTALNEDAHWEMSDKNLNDILNDANLISPNLTPVPVWNELVKLTLIADEVKLTHQVQGQSIQLLLRTVPLLNLLDTPFSPISKQKKRHIRNIPLPVDLVPRLSVMQLKYWLNEPQSHESALKKALATTLNEYQHLRTSKNKGTAFKKFHANWEAMQTILNVSKFPSFIRHAYELSQLWQHEQLRHLDDKLARILNQKLVGVSKMVKSDFVSIDSTMSEEQAYAGLPEDERTKFWLKDVRFQYVFLPKNQNYPGLDIVSFFENTKGEVFALIEQVKYKYFEQSEFSSSDVHPREFVIQHFNSLFPDHGIPDKNIIFAVVAFKTVTDLVAKNTFTSKGVDVVAGMEHLRKSYGPSFEHVGWLLGNESEST